MKYTCKKLSNQEMFAISLSSCSRYIMKILNLTKQCSLFVTVRPIFEICEDDPPPLVTHARDHWWTSDFANAFVFPGVNRRAKLVASPRACAVGSGITIESSVGELVRHFQFCTICSNAYMHVHMHGTDQLACEQAFIQVGLVIINACLHGFKFLKTSLWGTPMVTPTVRNSKSQ